MSAAATRGCRPLAGTSTSRPSWSPPASRLRCSSSRCSCRRRRGCSSIHRSSRSPPRVRTEPTVAGANPGPARVATAPSCPACAVRRGRLGPSDPLAQQHPPRRTPRRRDRTRERCRDRRSAAHPHAPFRRHARRGRDRRRTVRGARPLGGLRGRVASRSRAPRRAAHRFDTDRARRRSGTACPSARIPGHRRTRARRRRGCPVRFGAG